MSQLTPEERYRIYEEEKARIEARRKIEGEFSIGRVAGCLCGIALAIGAAFMFGPFGFAAVCFVFLLYLLVARR